jgi:hypothetical protein
MSCDLSVVDRTRDELRELGSRRGPIIVGPWLSEIGFELLYWIPFLRWAVDFAGLHRDDLWIISRGGCRSWYADISSNYVDVLDFYSPEAFREGNTRRMREQAAQAQRIGLRDGQLSTKQHTKTSFDREILKRIDHTDARLLHPSLMYRLFRPFWKRQAPDLYTQMARPARISAPPRLEGLPKSYVAAKFYSSEACPNSVIHRRMVNDIVRTVATSTDVVLLHAGTRYDEHGDFQIDRHPRVHLVPLEPSTNLETQTAVIGHASAFIGTYGGFAYMAPFLGVKARTFYARPNFRKDHRQLLDQVCRQILHVPFSVELVGGGSGRMDGRSRRMARRAA